MATDSKSELWLLPDEIGMLQFCVAAANQNLFATRKDIPEKEYSRKKDILKRLEIKLRRC